MNAREPLPELRDPFLELKEDLSFPVSPDFCARVRLQVAAEPVQSRMRGIWALAAAAVVFFAAAIGVMTTLRQADENVVQVIDPRLTNPLKAPVAPEGALRAASAPVRVHERVIPVTATETGMSFETVVPDDQLHALDRLLAAMRAGRATVPPVVADSEVNERGERVYRALVIEPVTVELLPGTPAEPIKNPVKDPNK